MKGNTKMLIGIAVVVTAGYMLWKQSQKPKSFANVTAGGPCRRNGRTCYQGGECCSGNCSYNPFAWERQCASPLITGPLMGGVRPR